jgi:hypothetical protein
MIYGTILKNEKQKIIIETKQRIKNKNNKKRIIKTQK